MVNVPFKLYPLIRTYAKSDAQNDNQAITENTSNTDKLLYFQNPPKKCHFHSHFRGENWHLIDKNITEVTSTRW